MAGRATKSGLHVVATGNVDATWRVMAEVVDEGHISGYKYAILHKARGEYIWWVERPGGTTCWRGNTLPIANSVEEAKEQIKKTMAQYGVGGGQ